jgi:glyoxylase-like metal-dependent hydrolase (beta-lactamase superfamily II)
MKTIVWLTLAAAVAGGCAQTTPEMQVINDAGDALGGIDRIAAVNTLRIEGTATNANLGQNIAPEENLPGGNCCFDIKDFRRAVDLANGRASQQQTRTQAPPSAIPQRQLQNFGQDGDIAFNVAENGQATRQGARVARDRRAELILRHPIGILRAALDPAAKLANRRTLGNMDVVDITTAQGETLTLAVNSTTHVPVSVTSMSYHINLGDVAIETTFADYRDVDGLQLPTRLTTKTDKYETADVMITKQAVNASVPDLAAPEAVKSAPVPVPTTNVTVQELGKGLWFFGGQSHNSVLVEFSDHTELIEAPTNEARALAVIAKARELKPDKPLTKLIVTHHHWDHSVGIRAAIAEGLTLMTHPRNKQLFEDFAQHEHSIVQDALAKNPKPSKIETVEDETVVKDAMRTMQLFQVDDKTHAETLIMVYFPSGGFLVAADLYNQTGPNLPRLLSLNENIEKRKLRVNTYVPLHGTCCLTAADHTNLMRSLKATATN